MLCAKPTQIAPSFKALVLHKQNLQLDFWQLQNRGFRRRYSAFIPIHFRPQFYILTPITYFLSAPFELPFSDL